MSDLLSGVVRNVTARTISTTLAADVLTGVTAISVDDTSILDSIEGGTLLLGGTQYDYTAVDDDAGAVTLASALLADASDGDAVFLWDTVIGAVAVETRAHVALPGFDTSDDYIDAEVPDFLASQLPEGIRDPKAGESVEMREQGDDWIITDVRSSRPVAPPAGGAILAAATYRWSSPDFGSIVPDTEYDDRGDFATYFEPITTPGGIIGIRPLTAGWYMVAATWSISDFTDGDVFTMVGAASGLASAEWSGAYPLYDVGDGAIAAPSICAPPQWFSGPGIAGQGALRWKGFINVPGGGTSPAFVSDAWLTVYKLAD